MSLQSLRELLRAAMLNAFKRAGRIAGKPTRTRKPQRRLQYPSRLNAQSIAHYDASIRSWIDSGRQGPKPIRRVEPKKLVRA